jgi:hypothetical protein
MEKEKKRPEIRAFVLSLLPCETKINEKSINQEYPWRMDFA